MHAEKKPKKQDIRIDNTEKKSIDESWDTIVKAITTAANEFILSTKIQNTKSQISEKPPASF